MATNTYTALLTQTLTSAVSSVTFSLSGITGYTDLRIVFRGGVTTGSINFGIRYNGDTGSNYSYTDITGDGGSATSHRTQNTTSILGNYYGYMTADQNTNILMDIMNYSNTTTYKTNLSRANNAGNGTAALVGLWRSTAAITSIDALAVGGTFAVGSTFTLYGIKAWEAETGSKATGGEVFYDSTYCYHAFKYSGTFTPTQSLTADVLVVAGGGGGGSWYAGGGGAGGIAYDDARSLTATNYTVTVGAGGVGALSSANDGLAFPYHQGGPGTDSYFDVIRAFGGGGGAGNGTGARFGGNGGSGGGGNSAISYPAGSTIQTSNNGAIGYGYAGSASSNDPSYGGGGGGGAGGTGTNSAGGVGLSTWSSWGLITGTGHNVSGTVYYAGGGGGMSGGVGGSGGGGAGDTRPATNVGVAGIALTGGGGGASNYPNDGKPGGSGVVIIRYPK